VIIYGQAPGRVSGPPLGGRAGRLLADLAGLVGYAELAERFEIRNLLPYWPGPASGKGDRFSSAEARARAEGELRYLAAGDRLLLLGKGVQKAFGVSGDPCTSTEIRLRGRGQAAPASLTAYLLPHPSGVNLWWNDPENREAASRFFREILA
jgi:uracil-DNA glycosylase